MSIIFDYGDIRVRYHALTDGWLPQPEQPQPERLPNETSHSVIRGGLIFPIIRLNERWLIANEIVGVSPCR